MSSPLQLHLKSCFMSRQDYDTWKKVKADLEEISVLKFSLLTDWVKLKGLRNGPRNVEELWQYKLLKDRLYRASRHLISQVHEHREKFTNNGDPRTSQITISHFKNYTTHANFGRMSVQQLFPALSDPNHQIYRIRLDDLKETNSRLPPLFSSFDNFKEYIRQVYILENRLITLHHMSYTLGRFCPELVEHHIECKREHYKTYQKYKALWREIKRQIGLVCGKPR
ncbi:hypothetical protein F5Y09DRAFT_341224 [Xylaria sp. FL1042]|nr:hypothetical protein F5Y09DRAFT_341224 [Xylaria sp. FL1042]